MSYHSHSYILFFEQVFQELRKCHVTAIFTSCFSTCLSEILEMSYLHHFFFFLASLWEASCHSPITYHFFNKTLRKWHVTALLLYQLLTSCFSAYLCWRVEPVPDSALAVLCSFWLLFSDLAATSWSSSASPASQQQLINENIHTVTSNWRMNKFKLSLGINEWTNPNCHQQLMNKLSPVINEQIQKVTSN